MALTYDDFLTDTPAAERHRAALTKTAAAKTTDRIEGAATSALRDAIGSTALRKRSEQDTSAVSLVEERIAQRIDHNSVTVTRTVAMQDVFSADPALYERYRRETGIGRVTAKSADADAEVMRRVTALVSKTSGATVEQALAFLAREDPALLARWQRESYA